MIELCTHDVGATQAIAARLADLARPRDLVLLEGDMGAGKTAFVQGFAAALGVSDPVTSPTFTLAHEYRGRVLVNHLDVYRLERLSETLDLALGELLDGDGVTIVEWGDAVLAALPADYLELRFTFGPDADDRRIAVDYVGPSWSPRWSEVATAVKAWRC